MEEKSRTEREYDEVVARARALMVRKNHDYGESWRHMRGPSITDQILIKVLRIRQLENLQMRGEEALVAEGIESEYIDILNYAVFGVLRLRMEAQGQDLPLPSRALKGADGAEANVEDGVRRNG